jgi:cob(I)alamin adenosyltransferase
LVGENHRGLVQIFTGNGKGKTTAAMGSIIRAAGHGLRVFLISFMKGDYAYGEYKTLAKIPNVEVSNFGFRHLIDPANIKPEDKEQAAMALVKAREAVCGGKYDLVVLDEVNVALGYKLIEIDEVIRLIKDKPPAVEVILTGRYVDDRLIELADLVTEMVKVKHPYDKGIKARKGIEY